MGKCCEIKGLKKEVCEGTTALDLVNCLNNSFTSRDNYRIYCIDSEGGSWNIYYKLLQDEETKK